uniref:Ig-like domain-containing protein n=1 Tax=Octactis speculum TaxID=3111310 RepID=A0A7S2DEI8_9STRA|mmetsp:Transcript_47770/g.65052  ORF Transcript_47770/g.65052 Transcript_47770/m.65052 type:complete len:221 (+) Transcript_47770:59-721(+)|eukprot:CAMPEP_0185777086 /NCGR_PEP_ID=MMETSP1174-20130828/88239_1 /TAXON_ID=35687 /ORGANISM="Dictyocha speculum, Strain CCMP1381" /LENGTH=220 /DNA_ID=CAMNT_0028465339 /DNA_START=59 /DNA_END=721 /DNA_ORIENTATION=-
MRFILILFGVTYTLAHEHWEADSYHQRKRLRERVINQYRDDYKEGTCGKLTWEPILANRADPPPKAVIAGHGRSIGIHGEDLYVCRIESIGDDPNNDATVPGKTWFERGDSCCNVAHDGKTHSASECQVLTVRPRAHSGIRLEWESIRTSPNQMVPSDALKLGNDQHYGSLYSCRFRDANGDFVPGQTWFPRRDSRCCSAEVAGHEVTGETCDVLVQKRC